MLGVNIGYLVGGTLVVEQVFALPGVGQLMINSIFDRDFPVVQGVTLVFAVLVVLVNLIVDIAHALLDPRVRFDSMTAVLDAGAAVPRRAPARLRRRWYRSPTLVVAGPLISALLVASRSSRR